MKLQVVLMLQILCQLSWQQKMNDKAIEQQMLQNAIQQVKQKYNEGTDDLVRTESLGLYKEGTIMILDVRLVYSNGNKYIVSVQKPWKIQTGFFVVPRQQQYSTQPFKIQIQKVQNKQQVRPVTRIMSKSQKQSNDRVVYDTMVSKKMNQYKGIRNKMENRNKILVNDDNDINNGKVYNDVYDEIDVESLQSQYANNVGWSVDSYKQMPRQQPPNYQNETVVNQVVEQLKAKPQLVNELEVEQLKEDMLDVSDGNSMMMVLGDCAENFDDCSQHSIARKYYFYELMARNLEQKMKKKIIKVGRIGGQYCKPRSNPYETVDGKEVFSYKGDLINRFDIDNRIPDPQLLLTGYEKSAQTLNFLGQMKDSSLEQFELQYSDELGYEENIVNNLIQQIRSRTYVNHPNHNLYTAHEALSLEYESGLVRNKHDKMYDLSAHFLWIGERTRRLDHAHIEFLRGIENPIGVKVSSNFKDEEFIELVRKLNPQNVENRLVIIIRMGDNIGRLRDLVRLKKENDLKVIWMSDPVHGNTVNEDDLKTRYMDAINHEISQVQRILKEEDEILGGIHLEATPELVNECIGIDTNIDNLGEVYTSKCDPRLNLLQTYSVLSTMAENKIY